MSKPPEMRFCRSRIQGLSLSEVLVTIAIVAVLCALLYPFVSRQKENALEVQCVSNLRNIGFMLMAYAADNNGYIMPRNEPSAPDPLDRYWHSSLIHRGYVQDNLDVFYCPAFPPYHNRQPGIRNIRNDIGQCYGMREWRPPSTGVEMFNRRRKLLAIEEPSRFFLVADSYWKNVGSQGYAIVPGAADQNSFIHLRHSGNTANALFADGSVRPLSRADVEEINVTQASYGRIPGFLVWPEASP